MSDKKIELKKKGASDFKEKVPLAALYESAVQLAESLSEEKNKSTKDLIDVVQEHYKILAARDYAPALNDLGIWYLQGEFVSKDESTAVNLFQRSAAQGNAEGEYLLGCCYAEGIGCKKNEEEAVRLYQLSAAKGYKAAQDRLGRQKKGDDQEAKPVPDELGNWYKEVEQPNEGGVDEKQGVSNQPKLAVKEKQLKTKTLPELFRLAMEYEKNGKAAKEKLETGGKNLLLAKEYYQALANMGYAPAQSALGLWYWEGKLVTENKKKAMNFFKSAAEQGNAEGEYYLAYCYREGIGGIKDEKEAVRLYRSSANQGFARAQQALGALYLHGDMVTRNNGIAANWYEKAAKQHDAEGLFGFAHCIEQGWVKIDIPEEVKEYTLSACYTKAVQYYELSAQLGNDKAYHALGLCYLLGNGVEKEDRQTAFELFISAAERGNDSAKKLLSKEYKDDSEYHRWLQQFEKKNKTRLKLEQSAMVPPSSVALSDVEMVDRTEVQEAAIGEELEDLSLYEQRSAAELQGLAVYHEKKRKKLEEDKAVTAAARDFAPRGNNQERLGLYQHDRTIKHVRSQRRAKARVISSMLVEPTRREKKQKNLFARLPFELTHDVLDYLSFKELATAIPVLSTAMKEISYSSELWGKFLYDKDSKNLHARDDFVKKPHLRSAEHWPERDFKGRELEFMQQLYDIARESNDKAIYYLMRTLTWMPNEFGRLKKANIELNDITFEQLILNLLNRLMTEFDGQTLADIYLKCARLILPGEEEFFDFFRQTPGLVPNSSGLEITPSAILMHALDQSVRLGINNYENRILRAMLISQGLQAKKEYFSGTEQHKLAMMKEPVEKQVKQLLHDVMRDWLGKQKGYLVYASEVEQRIAFNNYARCLAIYWPVSTIRRRSARYFVAEILILQKQAVCSFTHDEMPRWLKDILRYSPERMLFALYDKLILMKPADGKSAISKYVTGQPSDLDERFGKKLLNAISRVDELELSLFPYIIATGNIYFKLASNIYEAIKIARKSPEACEEHALLCNSMWHVFKLLVEAVAHGCLDAKSKLEELRDLGEITKIWISEECYKYIDKMEQYKDNSWFDKPLGEDELTGEIYVIEEIEEVEEVVVLDEKKNGNNDHPDLADPPILTVSSSSSLPADAKATATIPADSNSTAPMETGIGSSIQFFQPQPVPREAVSSTATPATPDSQVTEEKKENQNSL